MPSRLFCLLGGQSAVFDVILVQKCGPGAHFGGSGGSFWRSKMRFGGEKEKDQNKTRTIFLDILFGLVFDLILEVILVTFSRKNRYKNRHEFRTWKK